ncbi:MAG: glutathione ABC transporter permease GsiC [Chloroflexota bacterium]|nr:MAG: glutathione ABC transporter permease GsiC [Chloroflexota bacterium]
MTKRIFSKITQLLSVLFITSLLIFSMTVFLPGDPAVTILGEDATQQQLEKLRKEMGLDDPVFIRYGRWISKAVTGDLGYSIRSQEKVTSMLARRYPVTLQLAFLSMTLAVLIGIPAGVLAAKNRGTWKDLCVGMFAMSGMAIPYFWLGVLLVLTFAIRWKFLPPSGHFPFFEAPLENLKYMILPTITIGVSMSALVMRQTRTAMLESLSQDYVRTARAKGLSETVVVLKHTLKNALGPVVTVVGLQFGALMGGAIVTETIFSIPGIGRMVVDGIFNRDLAVVQGAIITIVISIVLINFLVDLIYTLLDKRVTL